MNRTKLVIYLAKAALIELVAAAVVWETAGKWPGLLTGFVTFLKTALQVVNTWGSFLSDPASKNGNGNGHASSPTPGLAGTLPAPK